MRKMKANKIAKNLLLGNSCHNCDKFAMFKSEQFINRYDVEGTCMIRKTDDLPESQFCKYWNSDEWLKHSHPTVLDGRRV